MIKKILIGVVVAAGIAGLVFGTDVFSYVTTSAKKVRAEVKATVPLDFEIERARAMVADLIPDIRKNMHVIAQEEVEVAEMRDQIARAEKNLGAEQERLLTLRNDLDNGSGKIHFGSRKASGREVRTELARRFERFQTAEATLKAKRQMLEAREKSLAAAREKLDGMFAAKRDLEVQVQNLDARLKVLQAAETASQFQFDDSHLARCKNLVNDLRKRLDVAERIVEQDGKLIDGLTVESEVPEDIVEQVDRYFGGRPHVASDSRAAL